jgi:hypothetical protein
MRDLASADAAKLEKKLRIIENSLQQTRTEKD